MYCFELFDMASPASLCLDLRLGRVSALSLPMSSASSRSLSLLPRVGLAQPTVGFGFSMMKNMLKFFNLS